MRPLHRLIALAAVVVGAMLGSGCTTTLVVMHLYEQATLGDPTSCHKLNSVERALQPRCGAFVAGSLKEADIRASGLPECPLTLAARQPAFWPVLPELLAKGASPEACQTTPWVALAQADACPDFSAATPAELQALRWLAQADARAVHHDVVRVLSCPKARLAGLDTVLDDWLAQDQLQPGQTAFGVLGALHPSHLYSPLARRLEARGHTAAAALGGYAGTLPPGYELALQTGDFAALDWWLQREPALANRVPPTRGNQLPWVPLARAITPAFIADAALQRETVAFLLARGADPRRTLPHDPGQTVVSLAERLHSPLTEMLLVPVKGPTRMAAGAAVVKTGAAVLAR